MASIGAMNGPEEGQSDDENRRRKRKKTMGHGKKLDFANEMQALISNESAANGKRAKAKK